MKERKGVAIIVVFGMLIMLSMLAIAGLRLMGNQGFITESSVRRAKAYYTAKAAAIAAFEECRKNPAGCPASTTVSLNNLNATAVAAVTADAFCSGCQKITSTVNY